MNFAEIVLPGRYSEYKALYDFVALFAEARGYSSLFVEGLQLSLKEAFVNAVKHGNRERDGLKVSCFLSASENSLLASVRDCGKGFDPDKLPDPADPRHMFKLSGRGVYIIRTIAEIVALEHDKEGSTLRLRYIPY